MKILCFDVGGTNIKYKLFDDDNVSPTYSIETRKTETANYILNDIMEEITKFDKLDAIGISTAGVVDSKKGEIAYAGPTIPGYTGTKLKETIEKKYNIPCFVENDVNSAAYGEYINSNLDGVVFCMTVGTGLGGAIIINDSIYTGNSMTAGEVGYMPYKGDEVQKVASATYLVNEYERVTGNKKGGREIFSLARKGDEISLKVIDDVVEAISHAILNASYLLNPKYVVIGGGITAQKEFLEDKIIEKVKLKIVNEKFMSKIMLAKLANDAGLFGIYNICIKKINK